MISHLDRGHRQSAGRDQIADALRGPQDDVERIGQLPPLTFGAAEPGDDGVPDPPIGRTPDEGAARRQSTADLEGSIIR